MKHITLLSCLLLLFSFAEAAMSTAYADSVGIGRGGSQYVLHVNDQLTIAVLGHDDYTKSVTILTDGTFGYPIVGIVPAAGKTVAQLTNYLQKGLSQELDSPEVTISVTQYFTPVVNVVGAVSKPGSYPYVTNWKLLDTLAVAGGSTNGSGVNIIIVRSGSNPIQVDGNKLLDSADFADNYPVEPGDTVLVQAKDASELSVTISGEVKNPGSYPVPADGESPTVALVACGGALADATLKDVHILHNGVVQDADLYEASSTLESSTPLPTIYPGDQIVVMKNPHRVTILGAVNTPAVYGIPEDKPLTVSAALELAGGSSETADLAKISVLRDIQSKPIVYKIDLPKILRGGDQSADIVLQSGDMLYVPTKGMPNSDVPLIYMLGPLAALSRL